jgi:integrase
VSRAWRRLVEAKGLPRVTFHALRHTHASILIKQGVDILTIMGGADAAAKAIESVLI